MILAALLFAAAAQDRPIGPPGPDDDAPMASAPSCGRDPDEITVCAADPSQFRAGKPDPRWEPQPLRPAFKLPGGGNGRVEAVQRGVGGVSVPSAMVTLKIPLGRRKKRK